MKNKIYRIKGLYNLYNENKLDEVEFRKESHKEVKDFLIKMIPHLKTISHIEFTVEDIDVVNVNKDNNRVHFLLQSENVELKEDIELELEDISILLGAEIIINNECI